MDLLSREQQRELIAIVLIAFALFLALALVPIGSLGGRALEWFPSGNLLGSVGAWTRDVSLGFVGIGALPLAFTMVTAALGIGGWMERERSLRLSLLGTGLLVILPSLLDVTGAGTVYSGLLGSLIGSPLLGGLGVFGGVLLLIVLLVLLSVGTVGWNPVGPLWRGGKAGTLALGRWLRDAYGSGGEALRRLRDETRSRSDESLADAGERERSGRRPFEGAGSEPSTAVDVSGEGSHDEPAGGVKRGKKGGREGGGPARSGDLPDPTHPDDLAEGELPPISLLTPGRPEERQGMEEELERLGGVLVEKLRTFNVECDLAGRTTGPVVTQYEVVPAAGVKVNRIANLDADLALAMRAPSVRIVAPIPGKGAVGVEIPNPEPEVVQLRDILEAREYRGSKAAIPLALGKGLTGQPYVADLAKMPHLLIAGATGSGKSVCINTIVTSLVYRHTPRTLRMLMIDPKMVELSAYAELPHLRHPVVTDPQDAAGVLKWAVLEMERRYALLSENGVRSITEFNHREEQGVPLRRAEPAGEEGDPDRWVYDDGPMPYIVVVVDELADLMMTVQAEVERPLTMLAQKARAIGIHLLVATQRPSVNVITGLIKANFPCRIAFRVASKTDSRTILDQNGADSLLGNGDMLFLPPGHSDPLRIQGAFVSTRETDDLVGWYRERADARESLEEAGPTGRPSGAEGVGAVSAEEPDILDEVRAREQEQAAEAALSESPEERDELFRAAAEVCIQSQQGSTSLLQRKLRIGYGRAARIVDQLEAAGILGPPDGSKPREILVGMDALDLIC